jgi:hypothetical protein
VSILASKSKTFLASFTAQKGSPGPPALVK